MRLKKSYLFLAFIIILLPSCRNKVETLTIAGDWEVLSIKDTSGFEVSPNFVINLETMKVAGFSGCNRFFGTIITQDNSLTFHNMGGTKKACPDFTVENLFITTIPKVKSFTFKKKNLLFLSESNETIMTLKPIETE